MTVTQQYPTSAYDLWKTSAPDDSDVFDDAHEHDDTCGDDCELLTHDDLVELAAEHAAERRAEDMAVDAYHGADW